MHINLIKCTPKSQQLSWVSEMLLNRKKPFESFRKIKFWKFYRQTFSAGSMSIQIKNFVNVKKVTEGDKVSDGTELKVDFRN